MKLVKQTDKLKKQQSKVSEQDVEEAVKTIIQWIGKTQSARV